MRVLIAGALGQLGRELLDAFIASGDTVIALDLTPPSRDEAPTPCDLVVADVTDRAALKSLFNNLRPTLVINAAAMTDVPGCEHDPARAFLLNAEAAENVATAATANGARIMHVSTDYVFDGKKGTPYNERDTTKPLQVYGASKLAGEHAVLRAAPRAAIIRVSALFGPRACRGKPGGNFLDRILAKARNGEPLRVVNDEFVSPTYAPDAATAMVQLSAMGVAGIIHLANHGGCSWHELALTALAESNVSPDIIASVTPVSAREFAAPLARPTDSRLDNKVLRELNLSRQPTWQDAVKRYVTSR